MGFEPCSPPDIPIHECPQIRWTLTHREKCPFPNTVPCTNSKIKNNRKGIRQLPTPSGVECPRLVTSHGLFMGERVRTRKTSTRNLDLTYDTRTSHRSTAGQGGNCILTESEILHGSYRPGEIMKVSQNSLLGSQIIYISSPPAEENVSWTWKINSERKKGRARWIMERWKAYCPQEQDVDSTLNVPFVYCFSYTLILRCLRGSWHANS